MEIVVEYSLSELPQTAQSLLKHAGDSKLILLFGEMGTGKTTLVKEFCKALGVRETVSSPTFSIVNEYESTERGPIYHFDLYRLKDEVEALDVGIGHYLDSGNLCLVEWPEMALAILSSRPSFEIKLDCLDNGKRSATLTHKP